MKLETGSETRLVIGCGESKPENCIGVDIINTDAADIQYDISETPWIFAEENSCEYVLADNVLEHFDQETFDEITKEISRVCEPGAQVEVIVPHFLNTNAMAGDHEKLFSEVSFDCYTVNHGYPTPKPQVFKQNSVGFRWRGRKYVSLLRTVFPDSLLRKHVPNMIDEIVFELEVVDQSTP